MQIRKASANGKLADPRGRFLLQSRDFRFHCLELGKLFARMSVRFFLATALNLRQSLINLL